MVRFNCGLLIHIVQCSQLLNICIYLLWYSCTHCLYKMKTTFGQYDNHRLELCPHFLSSFFICCLLDLKIFF